MQGYLAGLAGAKYVAPYINRIDNLGFNGVGVALEIQTMLNNEMIDCKVLGASFKNTRQIAELAINSIPSATVSAIQYFNLLMNDATMSAIDQFEEDYTNLCG